MTADELAERIRREVAAAPKLSAEQRTRLAAILQDRRPASREEEQAVSAHPHASRRDHGQVY